MIASALRYSALAALVLAGLGWLAHEGPRLGLASALLLLPLAAWPAWLALAYAAAIRKAQALSVLRDGVRPWWSPFLGGALARQVLAAPVALLSAWSVGWTILAGGWTGWAWIAATAVLLPLVAALLVRQTGALRPFARLRPVLLLAPPATAAVLAAAWVVLEGSQALGASSLAERVAAEPHYEGSSALLAWAVDATAVLSGARAWGLAWMEGEALGPALLWRAAGAFGQFWLLAGVFAGLLLPAGEARRLLRPCDTDTPQPVGMPRLIGAAVLLGLLSGAAVSALAQAEGWASARQSPMAWADLPSLAPPRAAPPAPRISPGADPVLAPAVLGWATPSALREVVEAERIGTLTCREGTIAEIETIDRQIGAVQQARRGAAEAAARAGFDAVRAQVPAFLDNYYSLTAEYVRTFHLVAGDAEGFLRDELARALDVHGAFEPFRSAAEVLGAPLPPELAGMRDRLLGGCSLLPSDSAAPLVTEVRPSELLLAPGGEIIGLRTRLAASGAGLLAGGVAGAILTKLVAKEAFGLAADAVAKLAVAKAAGGLGGAAAGAGAGALAGSVVPGIGTTVGAAVGGVLGGLALGVATDYALIRLEEAVSRDAFEAEIQQAIDEAEAELLAQLP